MGQDSWILFSTLSIIPSSVAQKGDIDISTISVGRGFQ